MSFFQTFEDHVHPRVTPWSLSETILQPKSFSITIYFSPSVLHLRLRDSHQLLLELWVHSKLLGITQEAVQTFYQTRGRQLGFLKISSTRIRDEFSWRKGGWCEL